MAIIIPFNSNRGEAGGSGDGPEDPMLEQRVARLETDVADIKASLRTMSQDINEIKIGLAKIDGKFDKVDGRFTGIEGYLKGIDARIASLPTVWTMLGIVFTTWALGSGILIFAMNVLKR
jgi:uncharacterized coiled-coil protein SlyX